MGKVKELLEEAQEENTEFRLEKEYRLQREKEDQIQNYSSLKSYWEDYKYSTPELKKKD